MLNEVVARNKKVMRYHKRVDKRLADVQKSVVLATAAVLRMADELFPAEKSSKSPDPRGAMVHAVDTVTLLVKSHW